MRDTVTVAVDAPALDLLKGDVVHFVPTSDKRWYQASYADRVSGVAHVLVSKTPDMACVIVAPVSVFTERKAPHGKAP